MSEILPAELAQRRDVRLLDVREAEELAPPFGYIPGARHLAGSWLAERPELLLAAFPDRPPLALYCMSGRRSLELLRVVRAMGFREAYSLAGGLLGWSAIGLAVTGDEDPKPLAEPMTVEDCQQALKSCFVAAAIESDLDNARFDGTFQPVETLELVLDAARREVGDEREALLIALDRLGELAWRRGHALDRIAVNMNHMRSMLASLES